MTQPHFVLRRTAALGDVVLATPVLRRLRQENPLAKITVQTAYPDVFANNPACDVLLSPGAPVHPAATLIDLDMAYERLPRMHIVDAYLTHVFGDCMQPPPPEMFVLRKMPRAPKLIAVHATNAGWRNRTLPREVWRDVVLALQADGYSVVLVGTERDRLDGVDCSTFYLPHLQAQAALIASCALFVGSDSGLLHVAGAVGTPVVGVFTCAAPEYRMPRNGLPGAAVWPTLDCVGCLHDRLPPVTTEFCARGDNACVRAVTAHGIVDAVRSVLTQLARKEPV